MQFLLLVSVYYSHADEYLISYGIFFLVVYEKGLLSCAMSSEDIIAILDKIHNKVTKMTLISLVNCHQLVTVGNFTCYAPFQHATVMIKTFTDYACLQMAVAMIFLPDSYFHLAWT